MSHDRRSILSALGLAIPFGIPLRASNRVPVMRLRSFEESVREAFAMSDASRHRIEVGYSNQLQSGIQGCRNDRPFAGFAAGQLGIVRVGCEPGPAVDGVRLLVSTVDVERFDVTMNFGRQFDFASLPPAPYLASIQPISGVGTFG